MSKTPSVLNQSSQSHVKLHENIAAIATAFAFTNGYQKVIDGEMTEGWGNLMSTIINWAEIFTTHENGILDFDWYIAVDDFVEMISDRVTQVEDAGLPSIDELVSYAKLSITAHATPAA